MSRGERPPSIGEYLFAELRQAFQDIRQKVIEEGWFGRVVTAAPVVEVSPLEQERVVEPSGPAEQRRSFEELWRPAERGHDLEWPIGLDIDL